MAGPTRAQSRLRRRVARALGAWEAVSKQGIAKTGAKGNQNFQDHASRVSVLAPPISETSLLRHRVDQTKTEGRVLGLV